MREILRVDIEIVINTASALSQLGQLKLSPPPTPMHRVAYIQII